MTPVSPVHSFSLNKTTVNIYHADKNQGLLKHQHVFPHVTVCLAGRCAIRKENVYVEITKATQPIMLPANEWHEIEALEDGTVFQNVLVEAG